MIVWRIVQLMIFGGAGQLAGCGHWQGTCEILAGYCFGRALAAYAYRRLNPT